ncbi:inner membrane protein YhjD [Mycolicibacterium fallax]|jgi:membrane protein|uniref:Inner membrane protein YhjD n=1 Tax=Mycolicibacterium fallax TaxID=1793 RepID=A0A1X1REX5_MYCFA|nr:inner membrane protein YhjD [Mycolicibacterium fallax]ORV04318.1 inner membrane protein YhjD [Mycolicibacterium fallax]BBY98505.1 inner membrane protein YhjD [Mycolicibacterium fallax]HOW95032.1 inner membrane protein YhjD [Mycolicibacterium fallax]
MTTTDARAELPETAARPGVLARLRARWRWFDHVWRAQQRYNDSKGDFYAAGITYYTIFSLFPLLMVAFAVGGFILVNHPELLDSIEGQIKGVVSGELGEQLIALMDSAIASRTSVGVIGLATAAWAGLGWMNNVREALTQMWGSQRTVKPTFIRGKLSDLGALASAGVALGLTIGLTALGSTSLLADLLRWAGVPDSPLTSAALRAASIVMSVLVGWALFTWMIARLPRESASLRSCLRAGLIAAVGFEAFKQVASIYLKSVLTGPAGATFGPVLGLMVFAYVTARLVLFATAWAATARENLAPEIVPPGPAVIRNRVITRPALGPAAAAAAAAGVGGWLLGRRRRR